MLRRRTVPDELKKIFLLTDQNVDFDGVIFFRGAVSNCGQIGHFGTARAFLHYYFTKTQAIARSRSRFAASAHATTRAPNAVSQRSGVIIRMAPAASSRRVHHASLHRA